MTENKIKVAYQSSKTFKSKITDERLMLGEREINTVKLLVKEIGYQESLNNLLLDLGCADRFLEPACQRVDWKYRGLDYTEVNFETDKLPVDTNSVDIAVSLAVIEHLRDADNFLSEIFRCLKPGGIVYLSTPNFQLDFKNFYNDPTHVRPYTPESLEQLLKLSGFSSVATFPGLRCKDISWYRGKNRFLKAYYFLPFAGNTKKLVPNFLKGHTRSIFALGRKPSLT